MVGNFVDLPADGDRLHFLRHHNQHARRLEVDEIRIGERKAPAEASVPGFSHRFLLCHKTIAATSGANEKGCGVSMTRTKSRDLMRPFQRLGHFSFHLPAWIDPLEKWSGH